MAAEHADLPALCSALIDLANERGGPDNITVVAARFEGEGLPEPGPEASGTRLSAGHTHVPDQERSPTDGADRVDGRR